jgi:hypothetical protein
MTGRLAALGALTAILLAAAPAAALADGTRTDAYPAGPYSVTVTRDDPVTVEQTIRFAVTLAPADGAGVAAIALPDAGTPARPVRAVAVAGYRQGTYAVTARFPVRGAWLLTLAVTGRAGRGQATVRVAVAAPGAIPLWLGWTIGLAPLTGVAVFLALEVRRSRQLSGRGRRAQAAG